MFKVLILQSLYTLSDDQTEFQIRDRLSFQRFLGIGINDPVPDATTIWLFREHLTRAGAVEKLFRHFDGLLKASRPRAIWRCRDRSSMPAWCVRRAGISTMARRRRSRPAKRQPGSGPIIPPKAAQKDTDARWTVKFSKAKPAEDDNKRLVDIAIPVFGYKSHIGIDRRHGLIRTWLVTDAAAHDGARLREGLIDPTNAASPVWADTAYRSAANEAFLTGRGKTSPIHRKKPKGRPMPRRMARANARKSAVWSGIEHVFAAQKGAMDLVIRTIGIARARTRIGLANLAYNMKRLAWLERQLAPA